MPKPDALPRKPRPDPRREPQQLPLAFFNEQPEVPSRQKAPIEQQPRGPYQLTRSRRKTLSLAVDEGQLQVRAPLRASIKDIESFIEEKKTWIDKQFQEDARRQNEKICLYDGASLQILDRNFSLSISRQINSAKRSRIDACMQREQVSLQLAAASDAAIKEKADKLFRRWLTLQAAPYLEQGTLQLASNMGLGNLLRHVRYRYTRSKWGHCTSEGDIQYNPAIVLAPTSVVDYIIAHEVCHLRHRNHSKTFWQLVAKACPDWRRAEHWLSNHGHRAEFWFRI